jgi:hypothetical protein
LICNDLDSLSIRLAASLLFRDDFINMLFWLSCVSSNESYFLV